MSFYKFDPSAWDHGTTSLTLEEEAAYLRIVNAMHKHMRPVPDNDRVLAGMFRCSPRKARSLVLSLVSAGKLVIADGEISNPRAASDLVQRGFVSVSRAESGAKGGRTTASKGSNPRKNNDRDAAFASPREEKRREEKSVGANAPTAGARDACPTFDDFWSSWPMGKVAKQDAKRAFARLSPADRTAAVERLPAWAADWRRAHPSASDMHPTTYLNRKRWQDEAPANVTPFPSQGGPNGQLALDRRDAAAADAFRRRHLAAATARRAPTPDFGDG